MTRLFLIKNLKSQVFKTLLFLVIAITNLSAQQLPLANVSFKHNLQYEQASRQHIVMLKEMNDDSTYDIIIIQNDTPIFRFVGINEKTEFPNSFTLITDKDKAIAQAKLNNNESLVKDITAAYINKGEVPYIGFLECMTSNGATGRLQIARLWSEDMEEEMLSVNEQKQ